MAIDQPLRLSQTESKLAMTLLLFPVHQVMTVLRGIQSGQIVYLRRRTMMISWDNACKIERIGSMLLFLHVET